MFNWNGPMRGPGFPQSQPMMPMSGSHMSQMSYQGGHPQWGQQAGMGMMMGLGWTPANQAHMFPQMMPGMVSMPVTPMMGGLGPAGSMAPAPPSQPPPPLPAEPPPPSPSAPRARSSPSPGHVHPPGLAPGQVHPGGPAPQQVRSQGVATRESNPRQGPATGSSAASGLQSDTEKAESDPLLVAELEKVKLEEVMFVEQYRQWKQQYDDWRTQNQNHPNKEQFGQYLEQWKTYEVQMESRRITIHTRKQQLENELARISAASASKAEAARLGSFVPSFKAVDSSQASSGKSAWDQGTQNVSQSSQDLQGTQNVSQSSRDLKGTQNVSQSSQDLQGTQNVSQSSQGVAVGGRENRLLNDQRAAPCGPGPGERFAGSGSVGPAIPGRMNQFAENMGNGGKATPVTVEEKGEEDMNLDEEEGEAGGAGIIEGGQQAEGNVWQGQQTPGTESLNQQSAGDWNSWNRAQENQWAGGVPRSARETGWADQTGRDRNLQQPTDSVRGQYGDGWTDSNPPAGLPFGSEAGQDVDSRVLRPGDLNTLGAATDGSSREGYSDRYYNDENDFRNFSQAGPGGGQFHRGGEPAIHRGRGGEFIRGRGRGEDFHRGMGVDPHRGRGGHFPLGRGDGPRGTEFSQGMATDYHSEDAGAMFSHSFRSEEFDHMEGPMRGRGGFYARGRGLPSLLSLGRGDGPRGTEFSQGMASDYHSENRGAVFNHSLHSEGFDPMGGPLRGRGGLSARGRGLPSLLSLEFNNRNQFSDLDLREGETAGPVVPAQADAGNENLFEGRVGREGQGYLNDDYEGSGSLPTSGRGFSQRGGLEHRGAAYRTPGGLVSENRGAAYRAPGGLVSEQFDGNLSLGQGSQRPIPGQDGLPWRPGANTSLTDVQYGADYARRPPLSSREGAPGQPEDDLQRLGEFAEANKLRQPDGPTPRDTTSDRGQIAKPDVSTDKNVWNNQPGDNISDRCSQQVAAGNVPVPGRERARRMSGHDDGQLQTKRGRFQSEEDRDENRVSLFATAGYDTPTERKRFLPAESIDYGHKGIDREKRSVQPAQVIDYGHGQSEVKISGVDLDAADQVDRPATNTIRGESDLLSDQVDRPATNTIREGQDRSRMSELRESQDRSRVSELREGQDRSRMTEQREGQDRSRVPELTKVQDRSRVPELTKVQDRSRVPELTKGQERSRLPELRDREASLRRTDVARRGDSPPSRRGDEFADQDLRLFEAAGVSSQRMWLSDDTDLRDDNRGSRAPLRQRDRFAEEEDLRGSRRSGLGSRDDGRRSRDKDSEAVRLLPRDDVRSTDYLEKHDDYYGRRSDMYDRRIQDPYLDRSSDYMRQREERQSGDVFPGRDGRYSSNSDVGLHGQDRDRLGRPLSPAIRDSTLLTTPPPQSKPESVKVEDLLCPPNRDSRPPQIVTIIRGLPGSGKTYVSKLLREKEISCGGSAPRMLCLDDYFMVDLEQEVPDPDTGKKVKKRVLEYEYEQALEDPYRQSLLKSFKKTIDDGFFPFIIVDATNEKVAHFSEFWSYAKSKGFQVYVGELTVDVATCIQRNVHHWTEWDIEK
ncbi:unnamed protein product, partial [Candidula unifasciata]